MGHFSKFLQTFYFQGFLNFNSILFYGLHLNVGTFVLFHLQINFFLPSSEWSVHTSKLFDFCLISARTVSSKLEVKGYLTFSIS